MDLCNEHITSNGYCADCDNLLWLVEADKSQILHSLDIAELELQRLIQPLQRLVNGSSNMFQLDKLCIALGIPCGIVLETFNLHQILWV